MINAQGLAENTFLVTGSGPRNGGAAFEFTGLASEGNLTNSGDKGTVAEYPFHYAYLASDSVGRAACENGDCGKDFDVRLVPRQSPIDPDPETDFCNDNQEDPLCSGTIKPDPDPDPELPGCEDEDLCEIFPPGPDPEDPDPEDDEVIDII